MAFGSNLARHIDRLARLLEERDYAMMSGDIDKELSAVNAVKVTLMEALDDTNAELGEESYW